MATYFTLGLQTGSNKYKSWSVSSPDFDEDYVNTGSVYANYDLTALGGSRTVKNDVGCLNTTKVYQVMNRAVWTFNFDYDITSVNVLWKTSQNVSALVNRNDDWVSINGRSVTLQTNIAQDYGSCYILLLVNEPLASATYTYTETLTNIISNASHSYNAGDNFSINYSAQGDCLIKRLASNIGLVTIADDKKSATLEGSATKDIVVEGYAETPSVKCTSNLTKMTSLDEQSEYRRNANFTIHYQADTNCKITSLTSTLGTVTIADDGLTAVIEGVATEDFSIEGVATLEYGKIIITGAFEHCSCNYSDGETISPSKPRLEIVADDGFLFLNVFKYKQAGVTKYLNKSDDNKMLYKDLTTAGLNLNDVYSAVTAPATIGSFVHLYKTTDDELSALAKVRFKNVSDNTVDYGQYINTLYRIPVDLSGISGDTSNIMLGQYDSEVASTLLNQYLIDIDGGSITIPEKFNNAYDYLTTECVLHLPFLDEVWLSPQYVINQTINIRYKLDLYSGTLTASIYSSYLNSIVANSSGIIVTHIPFMQNQTDSVVNSLSKVYTNLIPCAFMEVTRNIPYDSVNIYGKECVDFDMIGNKTGYLKCDNVSLVTSATKNEKDEIVSLLKSGVLL